MNRRAARAALRKTAAGQMNIAVDEGESGDAVDGDRHGIELMPGVLYRIVIIVIGEDVVRVVRIAFAAEQLKTAVGEYPVDAAARLEQLAALAPAVGLRIVNFDKIGRSEERRVGEEGRSRWSPHH